MVHILLVQQWPTDVKVLDTLCICVATIGYEWQNITSGPPLSHCWTTDCILKIFLKHYKPFHEQPHLLFSAILFQNINILRGPLLAHQLPKSVSFIIGLPMSYPRQKIHWTNGGCQRRTNRYTRVRLTSVCSLGCWLMKVIHRGTNRKAYHLLPKVGHCLSAGHTTTEPP